jgi:hypothetical protein
LDDWRPVAHGFGFASVDGIAPPLEDGEREVRVLVVAGVEDARLLGLSRGRRASDPCPKAFGRGRLINQPGRQQLDLHGAVEDRVVRLPLRGLLTAVQLALQLIPALEYRPTTDHQLRPPRTTQT